MKLLKLVMALLYFNMACEVTLGNVRFDHVNSIRINQSIQELEDTARLVLPKNFKEAVSQGRKTDLEQKTILEYIKVGDPVEIKLGYDDDLQTEFKGYISRISSDVPLLIECEDEMWQLKQTKYTKTFASVGLQELVDFIAPDYKNEVIDNIPLGKWIIDNASAYQVLEELKSLDGWGIYSYFVDDTLHVGFASDIKPSVTHPYNLHRNVRNYSNLKYTRAEDYKIQFKAISINKDGTRSSVTVGDPNGSVRTLHYIDKSESEMKALAEKKLSSLVFNGYQGSFSAFGLPRVKAGDAIEVNDPDYPNGERQGMYLASAVNKYFDGSNGFKNEVFPSIKL